jgi:hypothetical protein
MKSVNCSKPGLCSKISNISSAYPVTSRMPNCKRHETKTVTCRSGMMRSCNHLPHNVAKIANTIVRHLFANDTQSLNLGGRYKQSLSSLNINRATLNDITTAFTVMDCKELLHI